MHIVCAHAPGLPQVLSLGMSKITSPPKSYEDCADLHSSLASACSACVSTHLQTMCALLRAKLTRTFFASKPALRFHLGHAPPCCAAARAYGAAGRRAAQTFLHGYTSQCATAFAYLALSSGDLEPSSGLAAWGL